MPCLLVNEGEPGFGGLSTYAFHYMAHTTVCEFNLDIKSAKIVLAKQAFSFFFLFFVQACEMFGFL